MPTTTPITVNGLASGLDSDALIAKLVAANQVRVTQLNTQKSNTQTIQSAYSALGDKLKTLLASAQTLGDSSTYDVKNVTVSDTSALSVTATNSGLAGNYRITDFQRSTASRITGASDIASNGVVNVTASLTASGLTTPVVGDNGTHGSFQVNGTTIAYETNESMNAVLSRINNSDAGVTALYDQFLDRVVITNKTGGATPITLQDVGNSNFLAAVGATGSGATVANGTQAKMKIDGLNNGDYIYSDDDIFTESETGLTGLTFQLKANGTSADATVATDTSGIRSNFDTFVSSYNDLVKFIKDRSNLTGTGANQSRGVFFGDQSVQQLSRDLRRMIAGNVSGQTGSLNYLGALGVGTTSQDPSLSVIDGSKLESALNNNLNGVKSLLTDPTNGLMTQISSFVKTQATSEGGIVSTKAQSLSDQITLLNTSIDRETRKNTAEETRLRAEFAAMEKATSALQGGVSQLLSSLGTS